MPAGAGGARLRRDAHERGESKKRKTMRKFILCLCALCMAPLGLRAQDGDATARLKKYVENIAAFNRLFPQEKVYLHLDNTGYFVGETLWYKAYVVRTDKSVPTDLSRVLYVELVDPFGEIIETQKLKIENGQCHGDISLEKLRVDGFYEIRAYTRYNTNWEASGIFSRVIPVFKKPETEGDYSRMEIRQDFVKERQGNDTPDSLSQRELRRWKRNPTPIVRFYPEGGRLVRGLMSKVAFEATMPDSASIDVAGELRNEAGDVLSPVATQREGRGAFVCTPDTAALYLCFDFDGRPQRHRLPEAAAEGCVMTVNALAADHVSVSVAATPSLQGQTLGLTLMLNGNVIYFETHELDAGSWDIVFDRTQLPAGVHQLTLFNPEGRIYAQRQFFVAPRGE